LELSNFIANWLEVNFDTKKDNNNQAVLELLKINPELIERIEGGTATVRRQLSDHRYKKKSKKETVVPQ